MEERTSWKAAWYLLLASALVFVACEGTMVGDEEFNVNSYEGAVSMNTGDGVDHTALNLI